MSQEQQTFWDELSSAIEEFKPIPIEYRLHYNELGEIYASSMTNHPESNRYIVVDKTVYEQSFLYRVLHGKIVKIETDNGYRVQLKKSDTGFQVVKDHAGILLEENETYNQTEYYAYRNN